MRGFERLLCAAIATATLVAAGCSERTVVAVDPYSNDLVGFWRLNDGAGSITAHDSSVWRNDGTLVGLDPSTAWVSDGPEGTALSARGQGYVNVVPSASIDAITNQVTMLASIYLDGTVTDFATAISRQIGDSVNQLYHLSVNSGGQAQLIIDAPDGYVQPAGPDVIPQRTWVHLAGTWDGSETRLYVDGVEVASKELSSGPFQPETNPVVLAGNGNNAAVTELFPGRLADVMLYRRALGADEIAQLAKDAMVTGMGRVDGGGQ